MVQGANEKMINMIIPGAKKRAPYPNSSKQQRRLLFIQIAF
jgi:hypothetical protein